MDHILDIKKIVKDTLQGFVGLPNKMYPYLRELLLVDDQQQHFVLFTMGWNKKRYVHQTTFHLEVKATGEIWIHQNNTDVPVEHILIEKGISKAQIKISRSLAEKELITIA